MDLHEFDQHRRSVETASGILAVADAGQGPPVLFLHGIGTNGLLWRNVVTELRAERRCLALDLPLHGRSPALTGRDYSLPILAELVADACDALGLDTVDLVGNDTGGAIAQIFAARHRERLTTLTLTNCDTHTNLPPPAFAPLVRLAARGELAALGAALLAQPDSALADSAVGAGYEHPERLPQGLLRAYAEPLFGAPEAGRAFERFLVALRADHLVAVEPRLRELTVPTLIAWGTGDPFFDLSWAYWLRHTIPGVTEVVEIAGGKLFFPDERAADFLPHLRRHLATAVPATSR